MSKKKWLLAIIILAVIIYLLISKLNPQMGWSVDNVVAGTIGAFKRGIEASPIWQQYDVWFGVAFGAIVSALLVYRGRTVYDNIRGVARVRATTGKQTYNWQTAPATQPQPVVSVPTQPAQPTPVATQPVPEVKEPTA